MTAEAWLVSLVSLAQLLVLSRSRIEPTRRGAALIAWFPNGLCLRFLHLRGLRVFGADWGKEVRRLAQALPDRWIELVVLPLLGDGHRLPPEWGQRILQKPSGRALLGLLTSGRLRPPAELSGAVSQVIWLHPDATGIPLASVLPEYPSSMLLFPMMDVSGGQVPLKRAARQYDWEFAASGALTDDVRPVWPACMLQLISGSLED